MGPAGAQGASGRRVEEVKLVGVQGQRQPLVGRDGARLCHLGDRLGIAEAQQDLAFAAQHLRRITTPSAATPRAGGMPWPTGTMSSGR